MYELWLWDGHYIKGKLEKVYKTLRKAESAASKLDEFKRIYDDGQDLIIVNLEEQPIGLIHEIHDGSKESK